MRKLFQKSSYELEITTINAIGDIDRSSIMGYARILYAYCKDKVIDLTELCDSCYEYDKDTIIENVHTLLTVTDNLTEIKDFLSESLKEFPLCIKTCNLQ